MKKQKNVKAKSPIQDFNLESTILETLIAVKEPKDLIAVIMEEIRAIFPFDDIGLFEVKEDGWHRDFAVDNYNHNEISTSIRQAGILGFLPPDDALNSLMNKTGIIDFKELLERFPQHPHFPYLWEGGLREFISAPLHYAGETLGIFMLWSKEKGRFTKEDLPLFNEITRLLSIAFGSILEREEVLREKGFKETLLSITEALAIVHNEKELYQTIFNNIKPVFHYDDIGLFVLDDSKEFHYELNDEETVENPVSQTLIEKNLGKHTKYKHKNSAAEWLMEKGTTIVSMNTLIKETEHPQFHYMLEAGLKQMISAPLIQGGEMFGLLCFNSVKDDFYTQEHLSLFKNIAEQISITVSNILANEKILSEKNFKEKLLNISTAVSTITNRKQLFKVIFDDLKALLDFDNAGLFYIDNEKDIFFEVLEEGMTDEIQNELAHNNLLGPFQYSGAHKKALIYVDEVSLLDVEEQAKIYPNPQWEIMMNSGLKKMLVSPLNLGGKKIGFICFNTKQTDLYSLDNFRLVSAIAEQMSIALGNVIANEQLHQEKEFSYTLLKLTESIASSNNALELYKTLNDSIKNVIPFEQVGLLLLDPSKEYHYELINERFDINRSYTAKELDKATRYQHKNTSVAWLMENGPVIVSMDTLDKTTEHPRHKDMVAAGIKTLLGGPLVANGETFGMLAFKSKTDNIYNEDHLQFYKAISKQVAVTTSNILANKEILKKNELQSLELRLSKIIAKEKEIAEKWGSILDELKEFIPFSYAMILDASEDGRNVYRYEWVASKEKRFLDLEPLSKIKNIEFGELKKWEKEVFKYTFPKSNFLNELETKKGISRSNTLKLGYKAVLKHGIKLKKEMHTVQFFLFSTNSQTFLKEHSDVLVSVQNTLQLSLEKMFANLSVKNLSDQLKLEKDYLQIAVKEAYNFNEMVGESEAMKGVFKKITEVSQVDASVLLLGETGTGKELIARAIHENSDRHDKVLIKVNCAAIPAQIVESELFGHEKGAFTGAVQRRIGKFELAHKGTIFLDEIGEMPLELQTKLLRVLQERELERLGSNETIKLDFRVIAATNRNLEEEVANGKFRADLFYRLNAFPVLVPPLNERDDDVLLIADFFARQTSERFGLPFKGFTQNTLNRLKTYSWPGNVRELQNVIEQAIISQRGRVLEIYPGRSNIPAFEKPAITNGVIDESMLLDENFDMDTIKSEKDKLERAYLLKILEYFKWKVSGKNGAARKLGIAPSTLESRMKKLGIARS